MKLIHSSIYDAAFTHDQPDGFGAMLVVSYRDKGGKVMRGQDATEWAEEILSSMDQIEADALCRAIYHA